jgi:hypothetical protein
LDVTVTVSQAKKVMHLTYIGSLEMVFEDNSTASQTINGKLLGVLVSETCIHVDKPRNLGRTVVPMTSPTNVIKPGHPTNEELSIIVSKEIADSGASDAGTFDGCFWTLLSLCM